MPKGLRTRLPQPFLIAIAGLALLAGACGLVGEDEATGGANVTSILFSSDRNAQNQPTAFRNFFAPNDGEIIAVVALENAQPGTKVTGTWYTLGFGETPPEGLTIDSSEVTLRNEDIRDGKSIATFTLRSGQSGFPEVAWAFRVFVNGELRRTAGFIVTRAVTGTGGQQPPAQGSAPPPAPTPQTYTVQAGDTLQSIAQRFLPQGANLQTYITTLATFNNLQPNATLQPGQVLRIPPP